MTKTDYFQVERTIGVKPLLLRSDHVHKRNGLFYNLDQSGSEETIQQAK